MKRFLLVGTILFCAAVVAILVEIVRRRFEEKGSPSHLRRIAFQINEREWDYEDAQAEIVSAHAGDKRLSVVYRLIGVPAAEVDALEVRESREKFRRDSCEKKPMRELLDHGVTLHYVVRASDDVEVLNTEVLAWECTMDVR